MRSAKASAPSTCVPSTHAMKPALSPLRLSTGLVVSLVTLAACGGGGGGGGTAASDPDTGPGQAAVDVVWPSRGRDVPVGANSVVVAVLRNGKTLKTGLAVRPSDGSDQVVAFANLPLGTLDATLTAYASADGTGAALSTGSLSLTPVQGLPSPVSSAAAGMIPIVASLALSSSTLNVPQNASIGVSASGRDAAGTAVALSAGAVRWTSDAPSIASVSASGVDASVTGVAVGTTTIHAAYTRPDGVGVTVSALVTVSGTGGTVTIH